MFYSRWLPDRGGYEYLEVPGERRGLGDDLPTPKLVQTSPIGVASTSIGRPLPLGAKIVGYGPVAKGSIIPLDRSELTGLGETTSVFSPTGVLVALIGVGVGYGIGYLIWPPKERR